MCLARFRAHGFLLGFDLDDGFACFGMVLWAELQKFTYLICAPAFYLIRIGAVINADIERVSEVSRFDALVCLAVSRLDDLILGILVEMHTPQPRSGEELEDGFADAFGIKVHGNCHANHPGLLDFEVSFEQQFKSCGQGFDQIHFNLWRVKELGAFFDPPLRKCVVLVEIPKVLPNLDQSLIQAFAFLLANPPKVSAAAKKCDPPKVKARCQ